MAVDSNAHGSLTWEGRSVELGDIEQELNHLWHKALRGAEGQQAPVRTSVLNLVVYTSSDADAEEINRTVSLLSGRHPLRALILSAEPQHAEASLDTSIKTYWYEDPVTGAQACCEQVIVGANGEPANHLEGVVTPLLIPDLPVYLWWMGEPRRDSENFADLMGTANKLIIDTASFSPRADTCRHLLETSRSQRRVCAVTDLNWIRLWPWFEVVAQFFDDPALHPHLRGIRRVVIEYSEGSPAQAVLLAGWLFSRLGKEPAQVELRPVRDSSAGGGNVTSFLLETRSGSEEGRFWWSHKPEGAPHARVCAEVGERKVLERVVAAASRSYPEMLDLALESCTRDVPYEESLEIAAALLDRGDSR